MEATDGSSFTATASYTDFRGEITDFQMSGFGSFVSNDADEPGRAFGRSKDDGLIGVEVDQVGNIRCQHIRRLWECAFHKRLSRWSLKQPESDHDL